MDQGQEWIRRILRFHLARLRLLPAAAAGGLESGVLHGGVHACATAVALRATRRNIDHGQDRHGRQQHDQHLAQDADRPRTPFMPSQWFHGRHLK